MRRIAVGHISRRYRANVLRVVDGLLILPWEDAAALIADREAALDEKFAKPWLGEEPTPDEIEALLNS